MKPLYPKTRCKFCGTKLKDTAKTRGVAKFCINDSCYLKHEYQIYNEDGAISFKINKYCIFVYKNNVMSIFYYSNNKLMYELNDIIDINLDNYLDQIKKIKKLQIFK